MADDYDMAHFSIPARGGRGRAQQREAPIVPRDTIAGNALSAVVAIMTFLASLTTGAVMLVLSSAADWQSDVARELTIQIRPATNRDVDAEVNKAVEIARATAGIADVRPYTKAESSRLLEPWLGSGLSLDALPVPRIIVLRTKADERPDIAGLSKTLSQQVAGVSLDDHRGWIDRMRAMANTAIAGGFIILLLVLAATVLSVNFATRGAMAANRITVEVLFLIGAKDHFIASQFQTHFLLLGLKGGAIGGGSALTLLALAGLLGNWFVGTAGEDQVAALFGGFSIGWTGYAAVVGQIVLVAAVTALTSRQVVNQTLSTIY